MSDDSRDAPRVEYPSAGAARAYAERMHTAREFGVAMVAEPDGGHGVLVLEPPSVARLGRAR